MIAQVIVDVAAKQTDRVFEYHIPQELTDVAVGSRVVVPFGRRKVQGFVVGISKTTSYSGKLKDLLVVVDELPPLTPELVALSKTLADKIFAYRITILQSMLPRVMRANYRKILVPITEEAKKLKIFKGEPLDLNEVSNLNTIVEIRKLIKNNQAKIEYLVENKAKKKQAAIYLLTKTKVKYQEILKGLRKTAKNQQALLDNIVKKYHEYPKLGSKIVSELDVSSSVLRTAVKKGWLVKKEQEIYRDPLKDFESRKQKNQIKLNSEQTHALNSIGKSIQKKEAKTFLLEGITGSGKTEVYLHAISVALEQKRNALMLVPEISLTPQMVKQVKERFGDNVAVLHSGLSEGEKYDEWRRIRRGEAQVVVGARSAIFAPLKNIGLIVIDEEHESSYKQNDTPRYHARDVALLRSKFHKCPVVLGSATPSLASRAFN